MLSFGAMSGYDIRKEAATSIGHFWSESYGQIYPALRELAALGLARQRPDVGARHARRIVYEITPHGREALRRWLAQPPRSEPVRSELLLKLFFGDERSIDTHLQWIRELLERSTERRRHYAALRRQLMHENADHPSLEFWLATLSFGEHHAEALVRWCRSARRALETKRGSRLEPTPRARAR